jgi:hypothetical protein
VIALGALKGGCNEGIMDGVRKMIFEEGCVRIYVSWIGDKKVIPAARTIESERSVRGVTIETSRARSPV